MIGISNIAKMIKKMSEYKCEKHKLNFACLGCVRAWIARHDRMLVFLQTLCDIHPEHEQFRAIQMYAAELLKEIGKL